MNRNSIALFALAISFVACGGNGEPDAIMQNPEGTVRVVHQADMLWKGDLAQTEMEAVLERLPEIDVIYAHNDAMAHGAAQACKQKGRAGIKIIGVDGLAGEGRKYVEDGLLDATFEYSTCGAEAIDLALLACSGVQGLPPRIKVGTRLFTKANLAAGGAAILSPGAFVMANLRTQHAKILTTTPMIDVVFRVGMAQCTDDEPWRVAMGKDIRAAAARYPQIELIYRSADDDVEKQRGIVRDFIAQNVNAILISPKESLALVAVCKEAMTAGIKVIVLDRELGGEADSQTCFIGGDNEQIGREVGRYITKLLGSKGGTIVELQGLMTSSPAQERHAGFARELGLRKKE